MKKKIYIAGPMTGLPGLNHASFHAEAARLRALGHEVENPAEIDLPEGSTWLAYMLVCIPMLARCQRVHVLPGWAKSDGAQIEHSIAHAFGIELQMVEQIGEARHGG
jgi:hypothetical protein